MADLRDVMRDTEKRAEDLETRLGVEGLTEELARMNRRARRTFFAEHRRTGDNEEALRAARRVLLR